MRRPHAVKLIALVTLAAAGCQREQPASQPRSHAASPVDGGEAEVPTLRRPAPRPMPDAGAAVRPPSLPPPTGAGSAPGGGTIPARAVAADGGSAAAAGGSSASTSAGASVTPAADAGSSARTQEAAAPSTADAGTEAWTAGIVKRERQGGPSSVQLSAVRAAKQEGFDRVVIEFAGDALPGYHLEYVDRPLIRCGSGDPTEVAGQGWLQVRLTGARAHTEAGQPTVAPRERKLALPLLRELEQTCDFEGEVTWVLGLQKPNRFRVLELKSPTRLVVDVRH